MQLLNIYIFLALIISIAYFFSHIGILLGNLVIIYTSLTLMTLSILALSIVNLYL